jgi:hypothetical protein
MVRTPTGPQRHTVADFDIPSEPPTFTAEQWLAIMRAGTREAVVQTRQDDKLTMDNAIGLLKSQVSEIVSASKSRREKVLAGIASLGIAAAVTMGTIMATCVNAYQDARVDAQIPAARAEVKAEQAASKVITVADALEERLKISDERHTKTEETLKTISIALDANTKAVLGIAAKLSDSPAPSGKRPR